MAASRSPRSKKAAVPRAGAATTASAPQSPAQPVVTPSGTTTGATVTEPAPGAVATAITGYRTEEKALYPVLALSLVTLDPGENTHTYRVRVAQEESIPLITAFMRKYPEVVLDTTADVIDANYADAQACSVLSQDYLLADTRVKDTRLVRVGASWTACSVVLGIARKKAKSNKTLAQDLEAIEAKLQLGPREATAPVIAVKKQAAADHTTARAQSSQAIAAAATARAATAVQKRRAKLATPDAPATTVSPTGGTGTPPSGSGGAGGSGGH